MTKPNTDEYRYNCHFRIRKKSCSALNEKECQGCSFYKTTDRFFYEHEKAMENLHDRVSLGRMHEIRERYKDTWKELMG